MLTKQFDKLQPPNPPGAMHDKNGAIAPASWWEYYYSKYPLDEYVPIPRFIGKTIAVPANDVNSDTVSVKINCFAYAFRADVFVTATGARPTVPFRIGYSDSTGTDYTNTQWLSTLICGNGIGLSNFYDVALPVPLELPASTEITVKILNNVVAAAVAVTVDCGFAVIQPTTRQSR